MVVVCHEVEVGEGLVGVAGTPFLVHNLDVEQVVGGDVEVCFGGADAIVCTRDGE